MRLPGAILCCRAFSLFLRPFAHDDSPVAIV
jgi:hypothetical protein